MHKLRVIHNDTCTYVARCLWSVDDVILQRDVSSKYFAYYRDVLFYLKTSADNLIPDMNEDLRLTFRFVLRSLHMRGLNNSYESRVDLLWDVVKANVRCASTNQSNSRRQNAAAADKTVDEIKNYFLTFCTIRSDDRVATATRDALSALVQTDKTGVWSHIHQYAGNKMTNCLLENALW